MGMIDNPITALVGKELVFGYNKWKGSLAAPNGSIYGIPESARQVVKFNPVDKSITYIGPDFGGRSKWISGAITENGVIYCAPWDEDRGILKIDTNTDTVTELDVDLLPERGYGAWESCAAALDGCIYFMPADARRIMKLDPNNNDAMSSVGDDLGRTHGGRKYGGTVVGIDGCVHGIPRKTKRIVKYDPINDITSFIGEKADKDFWCEENGALGRDGCIYAVTIYGRVLQIDTTNNSHGFVGNIIDSDERGWGDAILGIDGCIYWPPFTAMRTLKYDPHSNQTSLVGDGFGRYGCKWTSGALAADGVIYCIPRNANQILAIDPLGEFEAATETNMQEHPEEFGYLFQTIEVDEDSVLSFFDLAVAKFGQNKVFEVLDKYMEPMNDFCTESNLCPFMIAASYKESTVCAINRLLRHELSWVNEYMKSLEGKVLSNKKRKHNS